MVSRAGATGPARRHGTQHRMSSPRWRLLQRHRSPARPPRPSANRVARTGLGQSVVEFALIVPVMLLILAGAIDLGRAFYAYVAVENAAKEGALWGARHPLCSAESLSCPSPRNVPWIVEHEASNLTDPHGKSLLTTEVACRTPDGDLVQPMNDCTNGNIYVVRVTSSFRLITPILGDDHGLELHPRGDLRSDGRRGRIRSDRSRGPRLGRQGELGERLGDRQSLHPGRRHRIARVLLRAMPGQEEPVQLPPIPGGRAGQVQSPRREHR